MKVSSFDLGGQSMGIFPLPHSSSTILLVDDEPDIVLTLQDLLEGEGYQIDVASSGLDALERVKVCKYDAVLLDIRLPDIDGLLVLEKVGQIAAGLPVIILTGCTTLDSVTGPLEQLGAFDFLHKPINRSEVKTAVRHAIKAQSLGKKFEQTHQALLESERRFQAVFYAANDAIVLANHHGRIISWNPAAESMFGYSAEEIFGQALTAIMPSRYREAHMNGMKRLHATGEARVLRKTLTLHGLRKNGQEFPIELSLNSWKSGLYPSYSGFIRDISCRTSTDIIQESAVE
jgi:PAS domain S-box-containing protein